jgi:phage-related protein
MTLFELMGTIAIDNGDANRALDETSQHGQAAQGKLGKTFGAIGKGAVAVGKAIVTGLAIGGAAMGGLTIKAMNLAGELEQNMGGSEQVFGEYAGQMQQTAQEAFANMGLSTSDFLATANKMGALFQGAGFSIEESSGLATTAMQRAADVASIMGIDTSAAMEAIAGAAKGNFTMMDNLGVAMNETTLNAYALEKGINKTTAEMTNQEKIALAMEMFLDKTAYAAGNYARENETLAGSLATAKAALTNFLDGSGDVDQLVSAFSNAANVIVTNIQEIAPRLVDGITGIINQITPMIPGLIGSLLPTIIDGAVSLINGLVAATPALATALLGCLPGLMDGLISLMGALAEALPVLMEVIVGALPGMIPMLVGGVAEMIVILCAMLPDLIQPIVAELPAIMTAVATAIVESLPVLIGAMVQLVIALAMMLPEICTALIDAWKGIFDTIGPAMAEWFAPIAEWFRSVWESFTTIVSNAWNGIKSAVADKINQVRNTIVSAFNAVKSFITSIWNNIRNAISSAWAGITSAVSSAVNGVKSTVSSAFNNIRATASAVWNGIKSAIQGPIESARDLVKGAIDAIKGFFDFDISWPHVPVPHFSISPAGWKIGDLLEGSIPTLGISWYAKAMNNPMIMDEPTIFGYDPANGTLMGGGEAGSELVTGVGTLMNLIGAVVDAKTGAQNERIIAILTALLDTVTMGNRDMVDAILAGHTLKIGEREFGRLVKAHA